MELGPEIRDPEKNLFRIPDPGPGSKRHQIPDPVRNTWQFLTAIDSTETYSTALLLRLRAGGDRSRSNSSYNQEEDISRLVECMALNTTSDEESEASEASTHTSCI
jgi:hypothetical protein